jgi:two-component system, NarL family, invasion response regulator UvrY
MGNSMPNLLIVDDFAMIRTIMCNYFETRHIAQCSQARDGLEAVQKVTKSLPDLVILDFAMPGMNGLETARAIRAIFPKLAIFLVSAHDDVLETVKKSEGLNGVFSKSNVRPLFQAVKEYLGNELVPVAGAPGQLPTES